MRGAWADLPLFCLGSAFTDMGLDYATDQEADRAADAGWQSTGTGWGTGSCDPAGRSGGTDQSRGPGTEEGEGSTTERKAEGEGEGETKEKVERGNALLMSYFCQFCDKEMRFEQSVVYQHDYVTCGKGKCLKQANTAHRELYSEEVAKQEQAKQSARMVVVFRSETPEDDESWRSIPREEHPEFLQDEDVMSKLLIRGVRASDSDNPDVWYQVMYADEVQAAMTEAQGQQVH